MPLRTLILPFLFLLACGTPAGNNPNAGDEQSDPEPVSLRVATYNTSMFRNQPGRLLEDLADPSNEQIRGIAAVIQINQPDIIFINEFDYDESGQALDLFRENFLEVSQFDQTPVEYPFAHAFPSNTGVPSGVDLDNSGQVVTEPGSDAYGQDSFGYGTFPGQYAFAVLSKYPLDLDNMRTFQTFLWKDMPDNLLPEDYYSQESIDVFRLSSKNHFDLPIEVEGHTLHLIGAHPTPPAFDGPERRNVRRNHDEVRLLHDYIKGADNDYIYDDDKAVGGLGDDAYFVIVGDLNADPFDGDSSAAIKALIEDRRVSDPLPESPGGPYYAEQRGGANTIHEGDPHFDTALYNNSVGNLRVDYVLPSSNLPIEEAAVFWPAPQQPHAELVRHTDHRLVWVDISVGE